MRASDNVEHIPPVPSRLLQTLQIPFWRSTNDNHQTLITQSLNTSRWYPNIEHSNRNGQWRVRGSRQQRRLHKSRERILIQIHFRKLEYFIVNVNNFCIFYVPVMVYNLNDWLCSWTGYSFEFSHFWRNNRFANEINVFEEPAQMSRPVAILEGRHVRPTLASPSLAYGCRSFVASTNFINSFKRKRKSNLHHDVRYKRKVSNHLTHLWYLWSQNYSQFRQVSL